MLWSIFSYHEHLLSSVVSHGLGCLLAGQCIPYFWESTRLLICLLLTFLLSLWWVYLVFFILTNSPSFALTFLVLIERSRKAQWTVSSKVESIQILYLLHVSLNSECGNKPTWPSTCLSNYFWALESGGLCIKKAVLLVNVLNWSEKSEFQSYLDCLIKNPPWWCTEPKWSVVWEYKNLVFVYTCCMCKIFLVSLTC